MLATDKVEPHCPPRLGAEEAPSTWPCASFTAGGKTAKSDGGRGWPCFPPPGLAWAGAGVLPCRSRETGTNYLCAPSLSLQGQVSTEEAEKHVFCPPRASKMGEHCAKPHCNGGSSWSKAGEQASRTQERPSRRPRSHSWLASHMAGVIFRIVVGDQECRYTSQIAELHVNDMCCPALTEETVPHV